jgi:hypothetical protein
MIGLIGACLTLAIMVAECQTSEVIVGRRRSTAVACTSGACYDLFNGTAGTLLHTYNAHWIDSTATYPVSHIKIAAASNAATTTTVSGSGGGQYNISSSGTSSCITTIPTGSGGTVHCSVFGTSGTTPGYQAYLSNVSGANWTRVYLDKDTGFLADVTGQTIPWAQSNVIVIDATYNGSSSTLIHVTINGTLKITYTDSTSPYTGGTPGFFLTGGGTADDDDIMCWADYVVSVCP